jgi:hypothetical protein
MSLKNVSLLFAGKQTDLTQFFRAWSRAQCVRQACLLSQSLQYQLQLDLACDAAFDYALHQLFSSFSSLLSYSVQVNEESTRNYKTGNDGQNP